MKKEKFDCVYTCGPEVMMSKVFELCKSHSVKCQASLERYIKCGEGICGHCAIGDLRVCKDGPVFNFYQLKKLEEFGVLRREKTGKRSFLVMYDIGLINGKIFLDGRIYRANIFIKDKKIAKISRLEIPCDTKIDVSNKIILPGLIDIHVHFREPGLSWKEDWKTGSKAAVHGGITLVMDMPNTKPPTISVDKILSKDSIARKNCLTNFKLHAGVVRENLTEMELLRKYTSSFKIFMAKSTGNLMIDGDLLHHALEKIAKVDGVACVHAEDQQIINRASRFSKNVSDPEIHVKMRPKEAEIKAVEKLLSITEFTGTKTHICHLTTKESVKMVAKAKNEGLNVTSETCPHYLFLTKNELKKMGALVKVNPPLRDNADRVALWEGIKQGVIDVIASDHAPHILEEKQQDILTAPSGIPGVETTLRLLLDAVNRRMISLSDIVRLMNENPSTRFGIADYGKIREGNVANLTVVDMKKKWRIRNEELYTKCGWSPYDGWVGKGEPVFTIINGKVYYSQTLEVLAC